MKYLILLFTFFVPHSLVYSNPVQKGNIKPAIVSDLDKHFNLVAKPSEIMIYGIVSLKCPCSQDSLKAFTELQNRLSPNSRLVVFDIGASTEENFLKMKQLLSPNFDFRYDPSKISVKTFGANVTPAAYILRNNNILYQSAVINPAKNPSPNFVLSAYNSILKGSKAKSKKAFGCMIEI